MIHNMMDDKSMVNEPGSPSKRSSRPLSRQGFPQQKVKESPNGTSGRIFPLKCDLVITSQSMIYASIFHSLVNQMFRSLVSQLVHHHL